MLGLAALMLFQQVAVSIGLVVTSWLVQGITTVAALFPKDEWEQIRSRFEQGLPVITHRVSAQRGQYIPGQTYVTPWGETIQVKDLSTYYKLTALPTYRDLLPSQREQLKKYKHSGIERIILQTQAQGRLQLHDFSRTP